MTYYEQNKEARLAYAKQYYTDHKEEKAKYQAIHREWRNSQQRKRATIKKIKIFNMISDNNIACNQCGCQNIRLLEINHIDGGGGRETKRKGYSYFLNDIIDGKREVDDLEILCRVCNARHYLESKYGKLPYTIIFSNK
ncbi:MAG: hypothetical protein E3J83_03240 [Candidatus Atribacteria bacterium]|nr:MAG: hypothetical protein E3J83_03240 [Candidatus Atribacteria bacterium]